MPASYTEGANSFRAAADGAGAALDRFEHGLQVIIRGLAKATDD